MKEIEYVNHDYNIDFGDKVLGVLKKMFPFPEFRHSMLSKIGKYSALLPGVSYNKDDRVETVIQFPDRSNSLYLGCPIIMPAGCCKYGEDIPAYAKLGFGGLSVGTATGKKREGNPHKPRVGMLPKDRGIHNAMGLNNPGIDALAKAVDRDLGKAHKFELCVGLSVAESPELQEEEARYQDLLDSFRKAYNTSDYVEINVSCPNTGNTRVDADTQFIDRVFTGIMEMRKSIPVRKAVYAKLSPDMNEHQLHATLEVLADKGVNGLILFNTFPAARSKFLRMDTTEEEIPVLQDGGGKGGISGRILYQNTFRAVQYIKKKYPQFSIIASGGIDHGAKVWDLLCLGVDAVQSYSVVAYRWNPIHKMRKELLQCLAESPYASIAELKEAVKDA